MSDKFPKYAVEKPMGQKTTDLKRRRLLTALTVVPFLGGRAFSEDVIELSWSDLLPKTETAIPQSLLGIIEHDNLSLSSEQPESSGVRSDWNGQTVRLPGYIVPIDYDGTSVTAFILVPYVGACVHVPPPPANQLVLVTTSTPYESEGLFEPVYVTGMFGISSISTHLADIGYALSADEIEPYQM